MDYAKLKAGISVSEPTDEQIFNALKYYVSHKTWMCAETSKINMPIDADDESYGSIENDSRVVDYECYRGTVEFPDIDFGLTKRPNTKLTLEKHITGLKIAPRGVGVQPLVDANAKIEDILNNDEIGTKGKTGGLSTIKSTRENRGYWKVETDVEELAQGAALEVEYTYVVKNESDKDYLSNTLVSAYEAELNDGEAYNKYLTRIALGDSNTPSLKNSLKGNTHAYGTYLGQWYYNGEKSGTDCLVPSRVEEIQEALNNQLKYNEKTAGNDFTDEGVEYQTVVGNTGGKMILDENGKLIEETRDTVVKTKCPTDPISTGDKDCSKTLTLMRTLASLDHDEGSYPSYIADITCYSNAAGRRNMEAQPANLRYVHSKDTEMTLDNSYLYEDDSGHLYATQDAGGTRANEGDEFWGESIIITKPTGGNKKLPMQIAIVVISSIAIIGVGILLIKKFALKR